MGEVYRAEEQFSQRSNFVKRKRARGGFPCEERPATLVVAHFIGPVPEQECSRKAHVHAKPPAPPAPPIEKNHAQVPAKFMDTASFAHSGGPPRMPHAHDTDGRVAHCNLQQVEYALIRILEKLKRESDNSSRCIPDLMAAITSMQINLPKVKR